ncbi:hypothetical protein EX30DRAFT_344081 [Ascodesmis nigricans]|uniref:SMP-30/Gluconolactonase/LRE-like region domain-containing protein n=1 Tax=Ascodesmis nigricans TaxID=341454 RepID=A0A4S2MKK2_9PEZI|nr:hypothetical protein EX30DRAFT_344081 [Ascodesmis nigricans]
MYFSSLLSLVLLTAPLTTARTLHARADTRDLYKAYAGSSKTYPGITHMGASIEGVSVSSSGEVYAVNQTHLMNLNTGTALHTASKSDTKAYFASSRVLRSGEILLGDAGNKKVLKISKDGKVSADPFVANGKWLQPNDMTLSADEKHLYLSGMNWGENLGDAWYAGISDPKKPSHQQIPTKNAGLYRTNGIELDANEWKLYITSAQNSESKNTIATKVYSIFLNPETMKPADGETWNLELDFHAVDGLEKQKLLAADMDLDGMRIDIMGNMFSTLNAYNRVVRWNVNDKTDTTVIKLATVERPTNLEFGGKDGTTLVVVGKCKKNNPDASEEVEKTRACVDEIPVEFPGRAFYALKHGAKPNEKCKAGKRRARMV